MAEGVRPNVADPAPTSPQVSGTGARRCGEAGRESGSLVPATVQAFRGERETGIAEALPTMGPGVTEMEGEGLEGPVDVISTVVRRQMIPRVVDTIESSDPDAFITVYDARVRRGWIPDARRK